MLGAAAGARRTDTAYQRLRSWANASQLSVVPESTAYSPGFYAALARLPQAAAVAPEVLYNAGLPPEYSSAGLVVQALSSAAAAATLTALVTHAGCAPGACPVTQDQRPGDIRNIAAVRDTPMVLGALLGLLAVGTLGHVLVTGVRRRRRDLAVLKTLGLSRGQVLRVAAWQAGAYGCVALLVGLPLGVLAGRQAWAAFAHAAGIAASPDVPVPLVLLTIPATLLIAMLLAAWPGWQAARLRPAAVLWTE